MSGRKRFDIIVNPVAGSRDDGLFDAVVQQLRQGGAQVRCLETERPGHATELAATAAALDQADIVVAAGGDGTINEVARGLLGYSMPLGILPLGTANVLGIEVGQRARAKSVVDTLLFGEANPIGTGLVGGEVFLLMVGVGFDGRVVGAIRPAMKRRLGQFAFIWEGLKAWAVGPGAEIQVEIDGVHEKAAWVLVTNVRHYAGPFTLSRTTTILEPGLEVFLFRRRSRLAFAGYFFGLALGRVAAMPGVDVVHGKEIKISSQASCEVEVDGDARDPLPLVIEQGTGFLRLVIPRG